ncbi:cystatin-B-like isoform X2 [Hyperolius riggenbachi]|uniref:cystatin-B-like isoform X2 n=1 Tax=Hyperolius riggenbachi TaxID=752182 RepID=UPI0035A27BD7
MEGPRYSQDCPQEDPIIPHHNRVKADFLKKSGVNASEFRVISYTSQVVAGTNYIAKVQCGPHSFAHLKVYAPLPHTKKPAELVSFQLNKSEKDQLGSF